MPGAKGVGRIRRLGVLERDIMGMRQGAGTAAGVGSRPGEIGPASVGSRPGDAFGVTPGEAGATSRDVGAE